MGFKGTLFGFQVPAVEQMLKRKQLLVAYQMGLGKTVMVIAACEELLDAGAVGLVMIICPASLKYQWQRMIAQFTEDATVVMMEGEPDRRRRLYNEVLATEPDYLLLNYEQVWRDWAYLKHLPLDCVVCDEVQAIKSFRSKRSRRVKRLRAPYRFGLTGQPVENRPEEVFSIMQWVDPEVLGRFEVFDRVYIRRNSYGGVLLYKNLPSLHKRLGEAMVRKRRDDPDVRDQLPKVCEETFPVPFDSAGAALYRHIVASLLTELAATKAKFGNFNVFRHYSPVASPEMGEAMGRVMSRLTCLRMLCDHPEMLAWSAGEYAAGRGKGSVYAHELAVAGRLEGLGPAPKFEATIELLNAIIDDGHKVALFSFFKDPLHRLKAALPKLHPVLFTGAMSAKERNLAKMRFATDAGCRLFLSSDAGGVGLDLPEARFLVNYNLPWSAGKYDQRQSRIIRLSSEWESVTLSTVLMAGSVEERMHHMLQEKRAVADAVVDGRGIDRKGQLRLTLDTLTDFLESSEV